MHLSREDVDEINKKRILEKKRMSPRFKFEMWVVARNNSAEDHIETEEEVSTTRDVRRWESQSRVGYRSHQQREDISFATIRWQMICDTTRSWRWSCVPAEHDCGCKNSTCKNPKRRRDHIWRFPDSHRARAPVARESLRSFAFVRRDWRWVTICVLLLLHPSGCQLVRLLSALSTILEEEDTQRDLFLREDSFMSQWLSQKNQSDQCIE